ncbi:MAG: hypothetical protein QG640_191 [Patescibacteria group bacterium]|nr:hypothetical protein [Patescibacteria group bacterium]
MLNTSMYLNSQPGGNHEFFYDICAEADGGPV